MSVIRAMHEGSTNVELAIADLATMAIFFCMRSCEYLKVPTQEHDRKTQLIKLEDIRFFTNTTELDPARKGTTSLAKTVCITLEDQKNGE